MGNMNLNNNYNNSEETNQIKKIKKWVIVGVSILIAIILLITSLTIVTPTQRGVKITLGKAGDTIIQPGLTMKIPLIQTVKKYDLSPKVIELSFSIKEDAAVTQDMQSVACDLSVYWIYDENKILDIINGYSDSSIKSLLKSNTLASIKEVVGKYSIYNIIEKQDEVTIKVAEALKLRLAEYPVTITNVTIGNWDWSDEFDKQIANTMAMAQQVKVAQQELEVTKQQSQKQVAEAEAAKQKAEIEAKMKVTVAEEQAKAVKAVAEGEAEAQKALAKGTAEANKIKADANFYAKQKEADADAYAKQKEGEAEALYYNSLIPYIEVIKTTRNLDIDEKRASNWNGVEVSTYLPMTANGTIVSL